MYFSKNVDRHLARRYRYCSSAIFFNCVIAFWDLEQEHVDIARETWESYYRIETPKLKERIFASHGFLTCLE